MAWKGEEKSDFPNEVAVVAGIYCYTSTITVIVPYGKVKNSAYHFHYLDWILKSNLFGIWH